MPAGAQSLDVAGARRTFVVRSAAEGDPKTAAPVVFALHPFGMNAQYMQTRAPIGRSWPAAITVFPDGLGRGGGNMAPSWQGRPGELGDRDLAFFDAMLQWLDEKGCIDKSRVFVLGYSNGAGLAYLLACERRAAVAGVAIAAGRLGCQPAASKPVIMSHGVGDRTIGYESAIESSQAWAGVNGCAAPPKAGRARLRAGPVLLGRGAVALHARRRPRVRRVVHEGGGGVLPGHQALTLDNRS